MKTRRFKTRWQWSFTARKKKRGGRPKRGKRCLVDDRVEAKGSRARRQGRNPWFFTRRSCQFRASSCGLSISNLAGPGSAVGIHAESSACPRLRGRDCGFPVGWCMPLWRSRNDDKLVAGNREKQDRLARPRLSLPLLIPQTRATDLVRHPSLFVCASYGISAALVWITNRKLSKHSCERLESSEEWFVECASTCKTAQCAISSFLYRVNEKLLR